MVSRLEASVSDPMPSFVRCPRCQHDGGHVTFTCHTTLGATCAKCGHEWAAALADMPEPLRVAVQTEMLNRDHQGHAHH
jgi:uncharacterized protein (DUF983 family)